MDMQMKITWRLSHIRGRQNKEVKRDRFIMFCGLKLAGKQNTRNIQDIDMLIALNK